VQRLAPRVVLIADYGELGAEAVVERSAPEARLVLVPLAGDQPGLGLPYFDAVFERADAIVVATESEAQVVADRSPGHRVGDRIHVVGLPLPRGFARPATGLSPSAMAAPITRPVRPSSLDHQYARLGERVVVVFTDTPVGGDDARARSARLVAQAQPDVVTLVVGSDVIQCWRRGGPEGASRGRCEFDELGWMQRAILTVDLRPGPLMALRTIASLVAGTPVVVPAGSRARQHAEVSGGGLWFRSVGEMAWCVEALSDPVVSRQFGAQGRQYAQQLSHRVFADRVGEAMVKLVDGSGGPRRRPAQKAGR